MYVSVLHDTDNKNNLDLRQDLVDIVNAIDPIDTLEYEHIQNTLVWLKSDIEIYRIQKPDVPPQHLVSYFVIYDERNRKILLGDHRNALLWLPSGGHVEKNESPKDAVIRECLEELGVKANFLLKDPLFLSITNTSGLTAGHRDVNLWYVLSGDSGTNFTFDESEYNQIKWFGFDEMPWDQTDENLHRFMFKLSKLFPKSNIVNVSNSSDVSSINNTTSNSTLSKEVEV